MTLKRAAIYVRTSTAEQSEKASPIEQERDCRALADERGLEVVKVYRDVDRYRVGRRLVEPSGTRSDRPGLLSMLRDAGGGGFDVLIAWREDRLYRGLRPMLLVLDAVEAGQFKVKLVRETFDASMAPIKAAIARMEIQAIKERTAMGVKARLRAGKAWGMPLYGYRREGDQVIEHPDEAHWVRQIFDWYASGVGVREIARRLIDEDAPRKEGVRGRTRWPLGTLYRMLHNDTYATGIQMVKRSGEEFEVPVPQLVPVDQFQLVQDLVEAGRQQTARHTKHRYLLQGLLTSSCGTKWGAYTRTRTQKWIRKSDGQELSYPATYSVYRCPRSHESVEDIHDPDCPKTKGVVRLDYHVWQTVADVLTEPTLLIEAAAEKLEAMKAKHSDAAARTAALQARLADLATEREAYVRKFGHDSARGGPFTSDDLDTALESVRGRELEIRREMAEFAALADTSLADLEGLVEGYLANVRAGVEWLSKSTETEAEEQRRFEERRKIVTMLVDRVVLRKDRSPLIEFKLNLNSGVSIQSQAA